MRDNFAVFILSHGRANHVITKKALDRWNYTGKWYIVIDNEDDQAELYYNNFGRDHVVMFDKAAAEEYTDTGDIAGNRKCVVYARNYCFKLAEQIGVRWFLELDDDYDRFRYRYADGPEPKSKKFTGVDLKGAYFESLDDVFEAMLDFLETSGACSVAFAQGGDYIGGAHKACFIYKGLARKAMNTFFCDVTRPFKFSGRINEDTTAYTCEANKGKLFFTVSNAQINQVPTQKSAGGLTDIYLDVGTYVKSFYSVLYSPQAVKVSAMGTVFYRIHHKVNYEHCCPKILSDKYKKAE